MKDIELLSLNFSHRYFAKSTRHHSFCIASQQFGPSGCNYRLDCFCNNVRTDGRTRFCSERFR